MAVRLDEDRRRELGAALQAFYLDALDEELSAFRADQLLDFFLEVAAPRVYNQAVQDARGYLQEKLDDLDGEIYAPEAAL